MAVTFPTFSRLQNHPTMLTKAIEKSLYFISLTIFPMLITICLFINPIVAMIAKYHKWEPALPSLILFTLSIGWSAISTPLTNTLNAIGQINATLKLMLIWTALTWILTPLLVWWLGFPGVAWSALLISFSSFLSIREVKKFVQVRVWAQVRQPLAAAVLMAGVGFGLLINWEMAGGS